MDETRWERYAAATGIAFVVLTLVAFFVVPQPPKPGDPVEEIVAYHVDNHGRLLVQAFLFGLAGAFFLWFLGSLRSFLRRAEGGTGRLSAVSFGGGVATVTLFFVGGVFFTGLATLARRGAEEAGAAAELFTLGNVTFALVAFPAAVLIGAASLVVVRTKALPEWLGWFGGLVALAALVSGTAVFLESGFLAQGEAYGIISFFAYLLWALLASVLMIQRLGRAAARM